MIKFPSVVRREKSFQKEDGLQVCWEDSGELKHFSAAELATRYEDAYRPLNATPMDDEWLAIYFAMLSFIEEEDVSLALGGPYDYLEKFKNVPKGQVNFWVKREAFEDPKKIVKNVTCQIIPEAMAHTYGYVDKLEKDIITISIGFGTVEIAAGTQTRTIVRDSLSSINYGLHIASINFRKKLKNLGYDNPRISNNQVHFWDNLLMQVVDGNDPHLSRRTPQGRDKIDLNVLQCEAEKVLQNYQLGLIEQLDFYFSHFSRPYQIIVTGGGCLYPQVKSALAQMFKKIGYKFLFAPAEVAKISAAKGYEMLGKKMGREDTIGVDMGNHSTIITYQSNGDNDLAGKSSPINIQPLVEKFSNQEQVIN